MTFARGYSLRSQAPAWERAAPEALPHKATAVQSFRHNRQAEPAINVLRSRAREQGSSASQQPAES